MATLSTSNKKLIWALQDNLPALRERGEIAQEIQKLESSLTVLESQLMLAQNPKDIEYFNTVLIYTNYVICALKAECNSDSSNSL
jgi:cell shape-determining protein MreC